MIDNEIIKALEECEGCHNFNECEKSTRLALSLINRQKAEIEELKKALYGGLKLAQANAVRGFAEIIQKHCTSVELNAYIDSLVEEIVGEGK